MGMSASQARLLSITARMNDVEFKSQNISNTKLRLADESERIANDYTKALNKQKFTFRTFDNDGKAVTYSLNSANMANCGISLHRRDGQPIPADFKYSSADLYDMIESGEYYLTRPKNVTNENGVQETKDTEISVSGDVNLGIEADSAELAKAEAEYNAATNKINKKEKILDNDLKALDTEHTALKTEHDSVKSLIGDNVEKSFNLFS